MFGVARYNSNFKFCWYFVKKNFFVFCVKKQNAPRDSFVFGGKINFDILLSFPLFALFAFFFVCVLRCTTLQVLGFFESLRCCRPWC